MYHDPPWAKCSHCAACRCTARFHWTLEVADYVTSGRATVLPVYKSTGERRDELTSDFPTTSAMFRDHVVMWSKDVKRRMDYLSTRGDIDHERFGYFGISWGAAMGRIIVATGRPTRW